MSWNNQGYDNYGGYSDSSYSNNYGQQQPQAHGGDSSYDMFVAEEENSGGGTFQAGYGASPYYDPNAHVNHNSNNYPQQHQSSGHQGRHPR